MGFQFIFQLKLEIFMKKLAQALVKRFAQDTICVVDSSQVIMYENSSGK